MDPQVLILSWGQSHEFRVTGTELRGHCREQGQLGAFLIRARKGEEATNKLKREKNQKDLQKILKLHKELLNPSLKWLRAK